MEKSGTKTIGRDYSLFGLMRFALPAILNEFVFNLLYTLDDGLFITRYVGTTAESAFSIVMPVFMFHGAISALFGGVAVLAARKMGEKKDEEACSDFTAILLIALFTGIVISLLEFSFKEQILKLLGCNEAIYPYAESFYRINCIYVFLNLTGSVFSRFYVPAGSPKMELFSTIMNVGSNFLFDWYFVVYRGVGMVGAAYANLIANLIQNLIGIIFYSGKKCEVGFARPSRDIFTLLKEGCRYGLPSFFSNLSVGVGSLICNYAILAFGDEHYLAAYTIVNNISFTFMCGYFGLFSTTGSLLSYAVGEKNIQKLQRLYRQIVAATGLLVAASIFLFLVFSNPIAVLFTGKAAADIKDLIVFGLHICPYGFPFFAYNVGARMSLSALGNFRSSSFITIMQEIVFSNLTIIVLPMLMRIDGLWYSFVAANILTFFVMVAVVYLNRDNYGYGSSGLALLIDR
jgi:Na+-driven multidrug efflux pump